MSFLRDNGYVVRLNTSFTHLIDNLPPPKLFHTLPNDYFYFTPHKKIFCVLPEHPPNILGHVFS